MMRQIFDPDFNASALLLELCNKPARAGPLLSIVRARNLPRLYAPSPAGCGSMMCVASSTATAAVISAQRVVTAT